MKVSELEYRRVTAEEFSDAANGAAAKIKKAQSVWDVLAARKEYLKNLCEYTTASALSYMRYSINTADKFYLAEKDYYDEAGPSAQSAALNYANALLDSPCVRSWNGYCRRCFSKAWKYSANPCRRRSSPIW